MIAALFGAFLLGFVLLGASSHDALYRMDYLYGETILQPGHFAGPMALAGLLGVAMIAFGSRKKLNWTGLLIGTLLAGVAALALPMIPKSYPSPRALALIQFKQIGTGILLYASDWDEQRPLQQQWTKLTSPYFKQTISFDVLHPEERRRAGVQEGELSGVALSLDPNFLAFDSRELSLNASGHALSSAAWGRRENESRKGEAVFVEQNSSLLITNLRRVEKMLADEDTPSAHQ
jgi:hypothetical protein